MEIGAPSLCNISDNYGLLILLLFLLHTSSCPASAQFLDTPAPPDQVEPIYKVRFDKSMTTIFVILVLVFLTLGFISIYSRQCVERRFRPADAPIGMSSNPQTRGLDPDIIHTFPTFVYSAVKRFKIAGKGTLECAVCLNEFEDHETLRFIPKCSHVFHTHCIDLWLSSHSTCPVCRANLSSHDHASSFDFAIQMPHAATSHQSEEQQLLNDERDMMVNFLLPGRSRSTGFGFASRWLLPRSHSTGHSLRDNDRERFTLRLPEEVRMELVKSTTLKRAKSCVTFRRMTSERRGYRTRSVAFTRSGKPSNLIDASETDHIGQPSSHCLCPPQLLRHLDSLDPCIP